MNSEKLRGRLSDDDLEALRQRNAERAAQAKQQLGRRWLCHPDNHVQKVEKRGVLKEYWS